MGRAKVGWLLASVVWAAPVWAQFGGLGGDAPEHVQVRFEVDPPRAAPGEAVVVRAVLACDDGWHVYATTTPNGIATSWTLEGAEGLTVGELREPESHAEDLEFVGEVHIYGGQVVLSRKVVVAEDAAPGTRYLASAVAYQTCDDANTACIMGDAQEEVALEVVAPSAEGEEDWSFEGVDGEVLVRAELIPREVRPGSRVELHVTANPLEGWHIYGTETPNGNPTVLELELPEGVTAVGALREPEPEDEEIEFVGKVALHKGPTTFVQRLVVSGELQGEVVIRGVLRVQCCDDANTMCIDDALEVEATLGVAGEPLMAQRIDELEGEGEDEVEGQTLWGLTGAAALLGLLMLLQPCTYPMIPITVSIFSKGQELSKGRSVLRAGAYAVGIVASFVLVGGVVQAAFGAAGQGKLSALATNPYLNVLIGLLFVYFAFSFFGYYELGLPAPIQRLMQAGNAQRGSDGTVPLWSLFLMGFFFVLTSYTCGAPIVLALFTQSAADPHPLSVVYATFVFASTVAAPFFVLSLVPGLIRTLPKSGSWFSVFKAVLGFCELGFALKFFRGADVMWELEWLSRDVLLGLWAGLSVLAAVYLVGLSPLKFPHDPKLWPPSVQRVGWGLVFVASAGYFGYGLTGRALHPAVESFILTTTKGEGDTIKFGPPVPESEEDVRQEYRTSMEAYREALATAGETGKPAFVMFTGHNCVNCQLMEMKVLPTEAVRGLLADVPRVALFVDKSDEAEQKALLEETYGNATIPAFYLVDGEGKPVSVQIGGSSEVDFIAFLKDGGLGGDD